MKSHQFINLLAEIFGPSGWPKPLHLFEGCRLVEGGELPQEAARSVGTNPSRLLAAMASADPVEDVLGLAPNQIEPKHIRDAKLILGQLLLGRCAELAFEEIYRQEMHAHEFELRDLRESRTDTDYRLYNGQGRPIYRINIKFHGSIFRRAVELVGLAPTDCFALATYKIHSALQKQEEEHLPYFFAIVGVPELTGEVVGESFRDDMIEAVALMHQAPRAHGKRAFEEMVVNHAVKAGEEAFQNNFTLIVQATWYMLSARKADRLLRELLFDRVFALRIRGFARQFRAAELDMHFSLSKDLVPLTEFLSILRSEGLTKVATLMERGEF